MEHLFQMDGRLHMRIRQMDCLTDINSMLDQRLFLQPALLCISSMGSQRHLPQDREARNKSAHACKCCLVQITCILRMLQVLLQRPGMLPVDLSWSFHPRSPAPNITILRHHYHLHLEIQLPRLAEAPNRLHRHLLIQLSHHHLHQRREQCSIRTPIH